MALVMPAPRVAITKVSNMRKCSVQFQKKYKRLLTVQVNADPVKVKIRRRVSYKYAVYWSCIVPLNV